MYNNIMNLTLVKKVNEATGTKSFFFEPDSIFTWTPGQYIYVILPKLNHPDIKGDTRDFTICSSPTEGNLLQITTKIREGSGYKKTLDELAIGGIIEGKGPFGTFLFDPSLDNKNNIFLAGGIGITPFRCFIKYNIDKKLNIPMHLIYSNTNKDEIAFKEELETLVKTNNFLKLNFVISSEEGHLDEIKLKGLLPKDIYLESIFWIVGPPSFVLAMEDVLRNLGVASDKIRIEKFTGY